MKKLKTLLSWIVAAVSFLVFAGCNSSGGKISSSDSSGEQIKVEWVAPTASELSPGTYDLEVSITPASASPLALFTLKSEVEGVSVSSATLTISSDCAHQTQFTVVATSSEDSSAKAEKTFNVSNKPVWNQDPVVVGEFFDDFSYGVRQSYFETRNSGWGVDVSAGEKPNYMSENNIYWSNNKEKVEGFGATGGVVALQVNGDLFPQTNRQREGSCLIVKQAMGAGKYEVRFKTVPRLGQVTALWTMWGGNGAQTLEANRYSEIDIEMPNKADYRQWTGTVYDKYISNSMMHQGTSAVNEGYGLNDGRWHTMAIEWRTDEANGDKAVQYYMDGVPTLRIEGFTPDYTARFWVGSWFPDQPGWVGIPDFETAYMYVDWIKITQYADPTETGGTGQFSDSTKYLGMDLGDGDIPVTEYVANSRFEYGDADAGTLTGWNANTADGKLTAEDGLVLQGGEGAYQIITAQYQNTEFTLQATASATGSGKCKIYICEYFGTVKTATLPAIEFTAGDGETTKTIDYVLSNPLTTNIRVVIENESGVRSIVRNVSVRRTLEI